MEVIRSHQLYCQIKTKAYEKNWATCLVFSQWECQCNNTMAAQWTTGGGKVKKGADEDSEQVPSWTLATSSCFLLIALQTLCFSGVLCGLWFSPLPWFYYKGCKNQVLLILTGSSGSGESFDIHKRCGYLWSFYGSWLFLMDRIWCFFKTTRSYFILVTITSLCDRTVSRNLWPAPVTFWWDSSASE